MKKPGLLRDHLLAAVPGLQTNPDRLLVFIDSGTLESTYVPGLSFVYRYTLNLILTDYAGSPDSVMLPLLQWLTRHQPEVLANPTKRDGIAFEIDVLANDVVDVDIKLPLSERVVVTPQPDGTLLIEHRPEPPAEEDHARSLAGGQVTDASGALVASLPAIPLD